MTIEFQAELHFTALQVIKLFRLTLVIILTKTLLINKLPMTL